ncbi:MAG: tRNA pseudouridine(55) synthase TruB [Christensenellales bacterium]|jgi:tRNA pseudouridine55 synthase
MNGAVNFLKPPDMTSSDAVVWLRRMLDVKKIGHGGTLDPAAAGVLPILTGKATRLFDLMLAGRKRYIATVRFGTATDTLDQDGEITRRMPVTFTEQDLARVLPFFTGEISQVPPRYSAVSIGGARAYDLARGGRDFELSVRRVQVYNLKLHRREDAYTYSLDITCSSGTYIRTLAADMAARLNTCAHLCALTRVQSGDFHIKDALTVQDIVSLKDEGNIRRIITPLREVLRAYPAVSITSSAFKRAVNGGTLSLKDLQKDAKKNVVCGQTYCIMDEEEKQLISLALAVREDGRCVLRPQIMLFDGDES